MSDSHLMLDAEEEIMNLDDESVDGDDRPGLKSEDSDDKLNSSSNSLDKYVGKGRNSKYMTLLAEDFEPGEMDVLCGRGKRCFNSPGNQRFRKLVSARAEDYSAATTRTDKTFIVCTIVSEVRKASPKGGFVKKDSTTGRWYEVGDFNAHEKTSQMFRDVLHESYLSSNKSKKKRRDLFRTNSKRRVLMQQQAQAHQKSINASSGRFLRANGVARHHSYGSMRVNGQQVSLLKMRQQAARITSDHSNPARADAWQNNSHSSWQNSWQSTDARSEPGMIHGKNPRSFLVREGSLGDLSGSIGELRMPETQPFHNSMGDLRFNGSFGEVQAQDNFHSSCGDFHNSFGEFNSNNNGIGLASSNNFVGGEAPGGFNNSSGGFNNSSGGFNNSFEDSSDFHNSFGEYVRRDARARAMVAPSSMGVNTSQPRGNAMYRRANSGNYAPQPDFDALDLQPPSVPLSISVPSEHDRSGHTRNTIEQEQFQLEFEDEESATRRRERQIQRNNGLSIVDALDTAGYSSQPHNVDENPFEPVPVADLDNIELDFENGMQMETIF